VNVRERCVSRLTVLESELAETNPHDFDAEELLSYVRESAAHIERFVKRLSFVPASGHRLVDYINELQSRGLPSGATDDLHEIRKAANLGKHDPGAAFDVGDVRRLVRRARQAVESVGVSGSAPGADAPEPAGLPRTYAILVADYPTGGEVDYEIGFLLDDGRLVQLDRYQLRYRDEEEVLARLRSTGALDQSPNTAPCELVRSSMKGSEEFSGIWLYDGDLRDVVAAFAPNQHSEAIEDLQRQADVTAVRAAAAMAAVDLGSHEATEGDLIATMRSRYAIEGRAADAIAAGVAALVGAVGLARLEGPRFVSRRRYELAVARAAARDDRLGIAIMEGGDVFVDIGSGYRPMP
jgi:hypothetical protein